MVFRCPVSALSPSLKVVTVIASEHTSSCSAFSQNAFAIPFFRYCGCTPRKSMLPVISLNAIIPTAVWASFRINARLFLMYSRNCPVYCPSSRCGKPSITRCTSSIHSGMSASVAQAIFCRKQASPSRSAGFSFKTYLNSNG